MAFQSDLKAKDARCHRCRDLTADVLMIRLDDLKLGQDQCNACYMLYTGICDLLGLPTVQRYEKIRILLKNKPIGKGPLRVNVAAGGKPGRIFKLHVYTTPGANNSWDPFSKVHMLREANFGFRRAMHSMACYRFR